LTGFLEKFAFSEFAWYLVTGQTDQSESISYFGLEAKLCQL